MSEVRKQSDGSVISIQAFKDANKSVSFPNPLTDESASLFGYNLVLEGTKPTPNTVYEQITRDGCEEKEGKWYQKWTLTTGDTATIDAAKAKDERAKRDNLLSSTDFYALSDVTMSDEMKTYRQALRDLPADDSGWPHSVTWPTKPS